MTDQHHFFASGHVPDNLIDRLIVVTEAAVRYRVAAYRNTFDLTDVQYRLLMHVAQNSPIMLSQLARMVNRDTAQISRMAKSLMERGLLRSGRRPGKQAMAIELTSKGREVYRQMARIGQDWEMAVESLLSPDEIALASVSMERLYDAARAVPGDERGAPQATESAVGAAATAETWLSGRGQRPQPSLRRTMRDDMLRS